MKRKIRVRRNGPGGGWVVWCRCCPRTHWCITFDQAIEMAGVHVALWHPRHDA
jgi:hypothetical protein